MWSNMFLQRLEQLEKEEEEREKTGVYDEDMSEEDEEAAKIHLLANRYETIRLPSSRYAYLPAKATRYSFCIISIKSRKILLLQK